MQMRIYPRRKGVNRGARRWELRYSRQGMAFTIRVVETLFQCTTQAMYDIHCHGSENKRMHMRHSWLTVHASTRVGTVASPSDSRSEQSK
jgi:hypothetical protein